MTPFERAVEFVLRQEGGYVNDPRDPGGETNFGISRKAFPNEDIRGMTRMRACEIYRKHYWNAVRADEMPDGIGFMVFDLAVNAGVRRSIELLQRACGICEDGILGPVTMEAAQHVSPSALGAVRAEFYRTLPTFHIYGAGWIRRTNEAVAAARGMQMLSA